MAGDFTEVKFDGIMEGGEIVDEQTEKSHHYSKSMIQKQDDKSPESLLKRHHEHVKDEESWLCGSRTTKVL